MISVAQALEQAVGHHQAGNFAAAEQLYRQILQVQPDHFDALHLLGVIACQFNRPEKGAEHITAALRINPLVAEAHNNLGNAFQSLGKIREATSAYRQALLINPNYAQPHNNLGNVFEEQDQLDEAIACYRQAIAVQPDYADAYNNLGFALRVQGKLDEAAANYQQAVRIIPNSAEFHKNLGVIWLLQGNLKDGWAEYEWRFRGEGFSLQEYSQPLWDGTQLDGRTILIHPDQGLGDIINFVRYVPMVQKMGGRVLLPCSVELARLLKTCAGIEQIIPAGAPLPPFDVHIPLLCLPRLLGSTAIERIPTDVPYLSADPELVERWRSRLEHVQGLRVGLTWWSSPSHRGHKRKSVPLDRFLPLAKIPGVSLVSLQKGPGVEQLEQYPGLALNLGPELSDLAETAAVLKCLDLVISIDTALCHLAGALAIPTWVPLPFAPDWRWLMERADTPWYPTMRLFRQKRLGDWQEPFKRIAGELAANIDKGS
jgi:Flp pilus assembly protein TadD